MKRPITITAAAAVAGAALVLAAATASAAPAGVVHTGTTFNTTRIKGDALVHAELAFKVYNPPQSGEFDMRVQVFHPKEDEWKTVGKPDTKNLAGMYAGETFTMRRYEECPEGSNLSWRIRLWVSPGIAQDGTATPPEIVFYPHKAGKQMDCRK